MVTTARHGQGRTDASGNDTGMGRAFLLLCGLHQGIPGWWRQSWFILSIFGALPFWLWLWWSGVGPMTTWTSGPLMLYLSLSLWQPLCEELGFRGLLQGVLLDHAPYRFHVGSLTLANLLTTVAFGIAHLPGRPLLWVGGIFAVSLLLGYTRDRSGSILPAIALHGYFNAGYFLISGLPMSS